MKKVIKKMALVALTIGCLSVANAQKIAHISLDSLVNLMPETKTAKDLAQNYLKDLEKTVSTMSSEYETKLNAYQQDAATMSDLVRKTKEEELIGMQKRIEDFRMQAQQDYQRKSAELTAPIMDKAKKGIEAVAKEGGYKYVLDTSAGNVLYSEPSEDILMQVKKKLDAMPAAAIPGANGTTGGVKPPKGGTAPAPKGK
ncbi:MAG: OmpH family outer membrane protein [Sediminibacterium sp.]|nr:OmpH family outer membrane protein [Sediminibacterium sp.]